MLSGLDDIGGYFKQMHYPFNKQQNLDLFRIESICRRQNRCDSESEVCYDLRKNHSVEKRKCCLTLCGKEKMLLTSIFSFSHIVFKNFVIQDHLKSGLCGKELNQYLHTMVFVI